MDIAAILKWLEATSLATNIRESLFFFPFLEAAHVIGLALVFGTIIVIDLRLLGKASSERPFEVVATDILKWTWVAFALTGVTGSLMFITNADVYFHNTYFRVKMMLLLLTAVNMGAFEVTARKRVQEWNKAASAPRSGRIVAAVSLILWIGVIFTGRLIGFSTSHATAPKELPADVNFDDLFTK
ncbi:MAG: DUF6644 family protein [Bryobacteraceae bacterium]